MKHDKPHKDPRTGKMGSGTRTHATPGKKKPTLGTTRGQTTRKLKKG